MATLTIRDFDEELKSALRVRAAQHGRSMEAEVREILRTAAANALVGRSLTNDRPGYQRHLGARS